MHRSAVNASKPTGFTLVELLVVIAIIGVLVAARSHGEKVFAESDAEWLSGLADYAAIAVRNARANAQGAQPPLDEGTIMDWQRELAQLTAELRAATETAQRLAALLAGEDQD